MGQDVQPGLGTAIGEHGSLGSIHSHASAHPFEGVTMEFTHRAARRPDAIPLGPIRSLHCFLPVIEELLVHPAPESYLAYLRSKVAMGPGDAKTPATAG